MKKYNNPRLNGTVVSGTGMTHPVRPHVIVGDYKMGYVRGDLMDANSVEEIHVELDNKIKAEAKTRAEADAAEASTRAAEDKKIQDLIDYLLGNANPDSINTLKEVFTFLDGYKDSDSLSTLLSNIGLRIDDEITNRSNADSALETRIGTEETTRSTQYSELSKSISDLTTLVNTINDWKTSHSSEYSTLSSKVASIESDVTELKNKYTI